MHVRVIHVGKKWPRAGNHMDARHCPECGATVHGTRGQNEHQRYHAEQAEHENRLADTIQELCKRTGITEESVELPWTWTAVVEESSSEEREAISG